MYAMPPIEQIISENIWRTKTDYGHLGRRGVGQSIWNNRRMWIFWEWNISSEGQLVQNASFAAYKFFNQLPIDCVGDLQKAWRAAYNFQGRKTRTARVRGSTAAAATLAEYEQ